MITNNNCPCKKKNCIRHGKCEECRKHHAIFKIKRPVYCEKNGNAIKIYEPKERKPFISSILNIWENSVKSTHHFLSDTDINKIKEYVPQALTEVEHLVVAENGNGDPIAFMGANGSRLEMVFISPDEQNKGYGKRLIEYGKNNYGINEVTVNEQNSQAVGFYKHIGFIIYKQTDLDEQGTP